MPKTKGAKDKKKRATRGKRGDEETRKRQENTANKHRQAAVGKGGADLTQLFRAGGGGGGGCGSAAAVQETVDGGEVGEGRTDGARIDGGKNNGDGEAGAGDAPMTCVVCADAGCRGDAACPGAPQAGQADGAEPAECALMACVVPGISDSWRNRSSEV